MVALRGEAQATAPGGGQWEGPHARGRQRWRAQLLPPLLCELQLPVGKLVPLPAMQGGGLQALPPSAVQLAGKQELLPAAHGRAAAVHLLPPRLPQTSPQRQRYSPDAGNFQRPAALGLAPLGGRRRAPPPRKGPPGPRWLLLPPYLWLIPWRQAEKRPRLPAAWGQGVSAAREGQGGPGSDRKRRRGPAERITAACCRHPARPGESLRCHGLPETGAQGAPLSAAA